MMRFSTLIVMSLLLCDPLLAAQVPIIIDGSPLKRSTVKASNTGTPTLDADILRFNNSNDVTIYYSSGEIFFKDTLAGPINLSNIVTGIQASEEYKTYWLSPGNAQWYNGTVMTKAPLLEVHASAYGGMTGGLVCGLDTAHLNYDKYLITLNGVRFREVVGLVFEVYNNNTSVPLSLHYQFKSIGSNTSVCHTGTPVDVSAHGFSAVSGMLSSSCLYDEDNAYIVEFGMNTGSTPTLPYVINRVGVIYN